MKASTDGHLVGASRWEQELYDMIASHEQDEEKVIAAYASFAGTTGSEAVRYLIGLIIEDEERHRRVLRRLADTVRAEATLEHRGPEIPRVDVTRPDEHLAELTQRFLEVETRDLDELERLRKAVREVSGSALAELTVELLAADTQRHVQILRFIELIATHPERAWKSHRGTRLH